MGHEVTLWRFYCNYLWILPLFLFFDSLSKRTVTAQEMKFSVNDFFSIYEQIRSFPY